jgi:hypothetical protein
MGRPVAGYAPVDSALVLAVAGPIAGALCTLIGSVGTSLITARGQRAQSRAAVQENIRDLLKAAMEFNVAVTNWHGKFAAVRTRINPFVFSAAQFTAGLLEEKPVRGFAEGLKSMLDWQQRSTAAQDAVLFGPMARVMECASRLLTSDTGEDVEQACMALMDAITATSHAYAGRGATAAERATADEQYNVAVGMLAAAARSAGSPHHRRLLGRRGGADLPPAVRGGDARPEQ